SGRELAAPVGLESVRRTDRIAPDATHRGEPAPLLRTHLKVRGAHADVDALDSGHLGRDHLLVPMPAAAGEIGVAVAVARLGLLAGGAQVRDPVERHPLGEGLVAQIRGGARRGGERTHDRSHADRDDRKRHEHLDEREAVASARASHGFDSTMGCSMTWPWSSWVTVTLRRPPSRSSVAAKLVRSPFENIITCGVLALASL